MLKIEHLRKKYDAFDLDCSLEIKPSHITGLIGHNIQSNSGIDFGGRRDDCHVWKGYTGAWCER